MSNSAPNTNHASTRLQGPGANGAHQDYYSNAPIQAPRVLRIVFSNAPNATQYRLSLSSVSLSMSRNRLGKRWREAMITSLASIGPSSVRSAQIPCWLCSRSMSLYRIISLPDASEDRAFQCSIHSFTYTVDLEMNAHRGAFSLGRRRC
jgi:hypothetical protein